MGLGHFHAVRFYESDAALCRIVATFLREGLMLGQPALVIATPEHVQGIIGILRVHDMDVTGLRESENLIVLDAQKTMDRFMVNGLPDADLFRETATEALDMARGGGWTTIRAYGEMVDLLWKDGRDVAAIQLEMLWNKLARSHEFSLLCGYSMGHFYKDTHVRDVCRQHTHLVSADGTPRVSNADSLLIDGLRP